MRRGRMLRYSLQCVVKSGAYRVFLVGVILSIALPALFLTAADNMLYTAGERQRDLYGEFTDLYYGTEQEFPREAMDLLCDEELKRLLGEETEKIGRAGNLYAVTVSAEDGEPGSLEQEAKERAGDSEDFLGNRQASGYLAAGLLDGTASELGRLSLKEGSWPQTGQTVITESLQRQLGDGAGPGGALIWQGKTYRISGILEDYGMLWVSNTSQSAEALLLPEAFFSQEDFRRETEGSTILHRTLMETTGVFSGEAYGADYNLVQNLPIKNVRFSIPPVILALVYVCQTLLLAQLLLLNMPRLSERMSLYRLLGVEAGRIPGLLYLDLFWIFVIALIPGLVLGIGGAALLGWAAGLAAGSRVLFRVLPGELAGSVLICAALMALSAVPVAVRLAGTPAAARRENPFRKRRSLLSAFLMGCLIFSVFFLYGAFDCYLKSDERMNLSIPVYGKLATDYDYEFLASTISSDTSYQDEDGSYIGMSVMEPDDIFTVYNEPYLGMDEEDLEILRGADGARKVSAYKECTQLKFPLNREDSYQRALEDTFISGAVGGFQDEVREYFDLEESYVDCRLQGYGEEELLSLASYVEEGEIDLEKIRSGEEVILMVPDLEIDFDEVDDGNGGSYQVMTVHHLEMGGYSGKENQYRDTYYHPGDQLTLTRLYSEDPGLRGFIKEDVLKKEVRRQDVTVTIGAVIRCQAGWFEKSNSPLPYFNFLCLNETFDALGISSTYTRVRVYGQEGKEDSLRQTVYRVSGDLPEMDLEDRCAFMEEYRGYHLLLQVLSFLLAGLSAIMGAGVLMGQLFSRIRQERRRTGLYQVAGYTRRRLFVRLILPAVILLPLTWALSMGAVSLLADRYYFLEDYWGLSKALGSLAIAAALTGLSLLAAARRFFKESISSLIRGED